MDEDSERLVRLEVESKISIADRHDIWQVLDTVRQDLTQVKAIAENASGKSSALELRVQNLEEHRSVSKTQVNIIFGVAGMIAAGIGTIAFWIVTDVIWPIFHKG